MSKLKITTRVLTFAVFTLALTSLAQAQATRTWVSGVGDDVNPCSRTAPCKTFAGAISKTAKDGEISTLDPGGFGTITITKSITINGGGGGQGYGSILSALAPQGVLVNITDPADVRKAVRLDWLNINGASSGTDGIRMIAGNSLHVENTVIDGVAGDGIDINASNNVSVLVRNTTIRNSATTGVLVNTTSGLAKVVLDTVSISGSGVGVKGRSNSRISIKNSTIAFCGTGVLSEAQTGGTFAVINVESSQVTQNTGVGVQGGSAASVGTSILRISDNQITNNGLNGVLESTNGQVETAGNNEISGNTPDGCAGCTPLPIG
jgi:hypothetical protein